MSGGLLPLSVDAGRAVYLLVAFATHAAVGYAIAVAFTDVAPVIGAAAALFPDADFLFLDWGFPFVHRGITHTPGALAAVLLAVASLERDRETLVAVGAGYLSHLLIDSLTPKGVPWLYPASEASFGVDLGGHAPPVTLVLWGCVGVVYLHHRGLPGDRVLEVLAEDDEQADTE